MTAPEIAGVVDRAGLAPISEAAAAGLAQYLDLLLRWNARLNLTAVREPEEIVRRHFLDSIECAQAIPAKTLALLDYGSGAGLPGIPIALCRPEIRITLAESIGKKVSFLHEAVRTLHIGAEVFSGRVETMVQEQKPDVITLRAVDKMMEALPVAASYLEAGGSLVIFASEKTRPSVQAALPGFTWQTTSSRVLPGTMLLFGKSESAGNRQVD
jgi:16S rRNA (guanine527-N7)-methyltransferase